ncbi:hypothetical protein C8R48DRAFT_831164 [Suillus tomentosus]|nr:hypothetical protein C8R48DRAFT_831164 [Suillus tomentosus]
MIVVLQHGVSVLTDNFDYPLYINFSALVDNDTVTSYYTTFDHSYNRQLVPAPFILGSDIIERQQTAGYLTLLTTGLVTANGTSDNTFSYIDTKGNTYARDVNAAYDVITYDEQSGSLATTPLPTLPLASKAQFIPGARLPGGRMREAIYLMHDTPNARQDRPEEQLSGHASTLHRLK